MTSLMDLFRAFPGGVAGLADHARVPAHTLYRVAGGKHAKKPVQVLAKIAESMNGRSLLGVCVNYEALEAKWAEVQQPD